MSSYKVSEPFQYDGRQDMLSLITWCQSFERYARLTEMPQHLVVDIAGTYLKGQALIWFNQLGSQTFDMDWNYFKDIMLERFGDPTHQDNVLMKWDYLKQRGSVTDYIKDFNNIHATMPDYLKNEGRDMHHFIKGLKLKTQMEVELKRPETLEQAMIIANKFDKIYSSKLNHGSTNIKFNNSAKYIQHPQSFSQNGPAPMQLDSIPGNRSFKRLDFKEKDKRIQTGSCFKCGEKGHYASKCLKVSSR